MDRALVRSSDGEPTVWLVTGVNGTGKTTTIGKLAAVEERAGREVVLAAADTFRAAAAEQLGLWAERTGARLVRKDEGADPAAVAFDGYNAAKATDADLLIVDTAGRLHNKRELMDELSKVKRVIEKQAGPLEETLLVLDATTGQNGIAQARAFTEAVDVTGPGPHQARRVVQGRHRDRRPARAGTAGQAGRSRRGRRRPGAVRPRAVRRGAVRRALSVTTTWPGGAQG